MTVRMSTTVPWPNPSEVFALTIGGANVPLILIAIMTFVLISSSGTMAMAVNFAYRRDRARPRALMCVTAVFGATFVGMQAFEWSKLILGRRAAWGNPMGAAQFGSTLLHDHRLSRPARHGRRDLPADRGAQVCAAISTRAAGFLTSRKGNYQIVEIAGLYWHFVDLVWVFIFAFFYLW